MTVTREVGEGDNEGKKGKGQVKELIERTHGQRQLRGEIEPGK